MNISERLKTERERLGLSQPRLGELAKAGKTTVINWEKGASAPDAVQLSALAAAGADVLYIVTGQRSQPVSATASLPARVRALVDNYENAPESGKKVIEQTASFAAQPKAARGGE